MSSKLLLLILDVLIGLAGFGTWWGDRLLKDLIQHELVQIEQNSGMRLELASLTLPSPNSVLAKDVQFHHPAGHVVVNHLEASFGWLDLLIGRLRPTRLRLHTASIRLQATPQIPDEDSSNSKAYAERIRKLSRRMSKALPKLPPDLAWENCLVFRSDSLWLHVPKGKIENRKGILSLMSERDSMSVHLEWNTDWINFEIQLDSKSKQNKFSNWVHRFDSIRCKAFLHAEDRMSIQFQAHGLIAHIPSFHSKPFLLPSATLAVNLHVPDIDKLELIANYSVERLAGTCTASVVSGNRSSFQKLNFLVEVPKQSVDSWHSALPADVFRCLPSLQLSGELGLIFQSDFDAEREIPLEFRCKTPSHQLRWQTGGICEPSKLTGNFTYRPWGSSRHLLLGTPGVDSYTSFEQISPLLRASVLNAEDGGFFWHQGFNAEALAESLLENLKQGYFKRGGSTLTMQLVKNVFLGREKTLSRKLEEIALVWLIERFRLCTKEKMFEQYLNLIEWGPEVYGIREAANYYFGVTPINLNALQSIFLASIIPSPRSFKYRFESGSDTLRSFNASFFQLIGRKLVQQKYLTPEQLEELDYRQLRLKGKALHAVLKREPSPDTLSNMEVDWLKALKYNVGSVDSLQPTIKP